MKTMFLSEIAERNELGINGNLMYSTGSIEYVRSTKEIEIIVTISGKHYKFHENIENLMTE
jgi:hypothetical protein